ncbi:DUF6401 family natural product biosynthesis protein [Nocardia farcinica]|uniref:DUF6401 family natural product biosynthesis protein n=1 Tax=Nocardia farcinica TaxID=37329 RepID=UPI001895764C|nr:DUF6401 family natural product biosynthesis protein [Nocardia farcinica]MBF6521361.1 hypothetical protein [Nocardia farcinica]
MFLLGPALLEVSAHRMLNRLHRSHGAPALAAAAAYPAVSAALDQHAAAVRDILEFGVDDAHRVPVPVLLAGYARGLLDHCGATVATVLSGATPMTGEAPADPAAWLDADWLQLRLASICLHARPAAR